MRNANHSGRGEGSRGRIIGTGLIGLLLVIVPPAVGYIFGADVVPGGESAAASARQLLREAHAQSQQAQTLEDYATIIELCRRAVRGPLSDNLTDYAGKLQAWAYNQRGEYYARQAAELMQAGQRDAARSLDRLAREEFVAAIELHPDYWKALHNRGVSRALTGQLDAAAADFSRAIGLKPDYANSWFNRGEIHRLQGRWEAAIADYTRAAELDARDVDTLLRRGETYLQRGQLTQALADFQRAVELQPDHVEALVQRAEVHRRLGRWERAALDYEQALHHDPESAAAYRGAAWLLATCPDPETRDAELALRAAQQALELLGPNDATAWDALAAAWANQGRFDQARQAAAKAVQLAPRAQQAAVRGRLELYQKNQPFREAPARVARAGETR